MLPKPKPMRENYSMPYQRRIGLDVTLEFDKKMISGMDGIFDYFLSLAENCFLNLSTFGRITYWQYPWLGLSSK